MPRSFHLPTCLLSVQLQPGKQIHIACRTDLKPRPPDLNTAALATRPKLFPNNKLWLYDTWCNSISPLVAKAPYLDTSFGPNQGRIRNYRCTRRIQECWCNYDHIRPCSKCIRHRLKENTFCVNSRVNLQLVKNNDKNNRKLLCFIYGLREKISTI